MYKSMRSTYTVIFCKEGHHISIIFKTIVLAFLPFKLKPYKVALCLFRECIGKGHNMEGSTISGQVYLDLQQISK